MPGPLSSVFQGVRIPLLTPFPNGRVDGGALRRLVRYYVAAGVDGFVARGSTGEAAALDELLCRWPLWLSLRSYMVAY